MSLLSVEEAEKTKDFDMRLSGMSQRQICEVNDKIRDLCPKDADGNPPILSIEQKKELNFIKLKPSIFQVPMSTCPSLYRDIRLFNKLLTVRIYFSTKADFPIQGARVFDKHEWAAFLRMVQADPYNEEVSLYFTIAYPA